MKKNGRPRSVLIILTCWIIVMYFLVTSFFGRQREGDCVYNDGGHWIEVLKRVNAISEHIKVFNPVNENALDRESIKHNECVPLKTLDKTSPICVYDPKVDKYISAGILKYGNWEESLVTTLGTILRRHPTMAYLDLGCNIGVFSIMAAIDGRRVVAVDPNKMNLRLMAKSLCLGKIHENVTLLQNAVSDKQETVILNDDIGNVGGTFAKKADSVNEMIDDSHRAVAVTLDDLRVFFYTKQVFIKMDVEGFEFNALKGGDKFMSEINVRYILMEWFQHVGKETAGKIIQFMLKYSLYPYAGHDPTLKLQLKDNATWPDNVLWIKT